MKPRNGKLITGLFGLVMLLALTVAVQAQYTFTTNANSITITKYTGAGGPVVIPSTLTDLPVTRIGDKAFFNSTNLTNITMSDGITTIGSEAFRNCPNLASVLMPDSVTSIAKGAFESCTSLTNAIIGAGVISIGDDAFFRCTSLTNIIIGASVTNIGDGAFKGPKLTGVYFQGNAPDIAKNSVVDHGSTVYYLLGTTGFGRKFDHSPTALWGGPTVVTNTSTQMGGIPFVPANTVVEFIPPWLGPGWSATNCTWNFGDGSTSTNCSPTHVYTNCQPYTVTYRGTDGVTTMSTKMVIAVPCALDVTARGTKVQAKLNFAKADADSFKLSALADLGAGFSVDKKFVMLSYGGAELSFTLDEKGRGRTRQISCGMKYNKKTNLWTVKAKGKFGEWQEAWARYGLTNEPVAKPGRSVPVPVLLVVGEEVFAAEKSLLYTAKAGKSGSAK